MRTFIAVALLCVLAAGLVVGCQDNQVATGSESSVRTAPCPGCGQETVVGTKCQRCGIYVTGYPED